ncbi:hypothetical protein RF11_03522 [Thelohanellus kitauei]|uniref:Uncharacterized protein n=1 Tax=Thelohanellus kitauei TaxID=669202 RepID=A0A0C2MI61_THEKT|nr:hypothetical protein RF11_03522 [Thelohanellus kitauei]
MASNPCNTFSKDAMSPSTSKQRDNRVLDTIMRYYKPGANTVIKQNQQYFKDSKLKPDILILTNQDGPEDFLIDAIIFFDVDENFQESRKSKINKHNELATIHINKRGKPFRILQLVVGSLGSISYEFKGILKTLNIPTSLHKKLHVT